MIRIKRSYRIDEAAVRLNVSRRTLYRRIESGELETYKNGSLRRIREDAIDEFEKKLCQGVPGRATVE